MTKIDTMKAYGWKQGDTFFVSRFPEGSERRPANSYADKGQAILDARRRGLKIEWHESAADPVEAPPDHVISPETM